MSDASSLVVFDVNETLSDMSTIADRFRDIGAPPHLAKLWFATLLRDGFALTAAGDNRAFADIGTEALRVLVAGSDLKTGPEEAARYVMGGMAELGLHPDVPDAIRGLKADGYRMVTLTNGSTAIAEKLFTAAGIRQDFEALLTVEDAPAWKPARAAYDYAARICRVETSQMVLVAVHPWDIHGAAAAGLNTVWLNRSKEEYPRYFSQPHHTIQNLAQLAQYV